jgi:NitT/TauT family transport system substrate-binding protein
MTARFFWNPRNTCGQGPRLRGFSMAAIACLMLLSILSCSHPVDKTTIQMAVGGQTQFIYLPLTLADRLGYFKDEGLTINISDLRGGSEALAAMMGGSVDIVAGFYEHTIRARAQGKRLVMVALFDRYPGLVLMVGKHHIDRVHSIQDLIGRPVGVTAPGSSTDQLVKYILRQNNLDPQAIPVVTGGISTMLAALEQDRVWAGVTVDPIASRLDRDGIARVLYDTRTEKGTTDIFGGPWPAGGFYTTEEFIQQHPQTVQSIVTAGVRALRFLKQHSAEEVAAAMPESFWGGDRAQYVESLHSSMDMYTSDGIMPPDGPPNVLKTLSLVDEKIADSKVDLARTYDNSFAGKVQ